MRFLLGGTVLLVPGRETRKGIFPNFDAHFVAHAHHYGLSLSNAHRHKIKTFANLFASLYLSFIYFDSGDIFRSWKQGFIIISGYDFRDSDDTIKKMLTFPGENILFEEMVRNDRSV